MKRTPLKRKTPLRAKTKLTAKTVLKLISPRQLIRKANINMIAGMLYETNKRCAVCGEIGTREYKWRNTVVFYLDPHHILPTSRGGKDTMDNIILVHRRCHLYIHNQPEYARSKGWLK